MALIINKSGIDNNGIEYPFIYMDLIPEIEMHYGRVSINVKCYKGIDISGKTFGERVFPSKYWEQFYNQIHIDYENGIESDLETWIHNKAKEYFTSPKFDMMTYKRYENDVFLLDEETGEPELDEETGEPIILNKKGDLIKKSNGTFDLHNKEIPPFCDYDKIEII